MSTYTEKAVGTPTWPMFAVIGAALAAVLTAVGTFLDVTGNESGSGNSAREYLVVLGIIAVATAIVFGLVVRTASGSGASTRALVLAIIGLLSSAVFWTGLPAVLVTGSIACAQVSRAELGRLPRRALVAVVISTFTLCLAVVAAIAG